METEVNISIIGLLCHLLSYLLLLQEVEEVSYPAGRLVEAVEGRAVVVGEEVGEWSLWQTSIPPPPGEIW